MSARLVSLAAGTVPDIGPAEAVAVAARAGFGAVGIWFDPQTWTAPVARDVVRRLADTGVIPLDIEPVIIGRGPDHGEAIIDIAAEIGVRHVVVGSGSADPKEVVERFAALCNRAGGSSVVVVLEFQPMSSVGSLSAALDVVAQAGYANGGVLVDSLHLARSGGAPADLIGLAPHLVPYLQIADGAAVLLDYSPSGLRDESLHGRLLPGRGDLPLGDVLGTVPNVPLSIELRSRQLMIEQPDPVRRASAVLAATLSVAEQVDQSTATTRSDRSPRRA